MNSPATQPKPKKAVIAAGLAAMAALATPIYEQWEGVEHRAYRDVVGIWTICAGDTRNVTPGQVATPAECTQRTAKIMEEYGLAVYETSPQVINHPHMWAALTIHTANIGKTGYARSTTARLYNAGRYREACRYLRNYKYAGGRVVQGLVNRREGTERVVGEYELCLADAIRLDLGTLK